MRNINVETITFTDLNGKKYPVKEMREYPDYQTLFDLDVKDGDYLDEIAARNNVFGDNAEDQSYMIFEANIAAIVEAGWDMGKLRRIKIPSKNLQ